MVHSFTDPSSMLNLSGAAVGDAARHTAHDHTAEAAVDFSKGLPARTLSATAKRDALTGDAALSTTFRFKSNQHSLLSQYDTITNFAGSDAIDARGLRSTQMILGSDACVEISGLNAKAIAAECCTKAVFRANDVCAFTVAGMDGTFVVLNDRRAGFQAKQDAVVFLAGYTVTDTQPIHIV